ncbi:hypothetical protein BJV74DRAFT_766646, partial [Russula compacta]
MSNTHPSPSSSSNFQLILDNALKVYEKQTKKNLLAHPLAAQLQACNSPTAILAVLQQQVQDFNQSRSTDDRLTRWLDPTINVLNAFSEALGAGVGLAFSPAQVIFAGVGVLLSTARDVHASQETLVDIFERIENFFRRLSMYTEVPPTPEMTDMSVKIMAEVLSILGIATKEIKRSQMKKFLKRLTGRTDLEDALKRLDTLTNEEARMAIAEVLKSTHAINDRVGVVDGRVAGVDEKIVGVDHRVASMDDKLADVDDRVAGMDDRVAGMDDKLAGVGDRVAVVNDRVAAVNDKVASVDVRVKTVNDNIAVVIHGTQFRWVFCQLETLRQCFPPSVRRTLSELPESLDETYERILKEIKKPNRDHALRLLQCLVVAFMPLRVEELAEVLAVDFDDAEGIPKLNPSWRWEDQEQAILSSCSSLITIVYNDDSRVVQFSHFSVKEFLVSPRLATSSEDVSRYFITLEPAHTILAQACLSIFLRADDRTESNSIGSSSPLAIYAAGCWVDH